MTRHAKAISILVIQAVRVAGVPSMLEMVPGAVSYGAPFQPLVSEYALHCVLKSRAKTTAWIGKLAASLGLEQGVDYSIASEGGTGSRLFTLAAAARICLARSTGLRPLRWIDQTQRMYDRFMQNELKD